MKKILFSITLLAMAFSIPTYANEISSSDSESFVFIEPKASYVFISTGSIVGKSSYGGNCALVDDGKGTMTIRLQKYSSGANAWITSAGPYSKSFSDTDVCAFSKSKILSKGKYRCRTDVKATVGSHTDSRTVYSPTLTIN